MKHVKKSVLLWYSPAEMYRLVTDVADYPRFLPWCSKAEVLAASPEGMTARLTLAYAGMRHTFTTRNTHEADRSVHVKLVDGPFSQLDGTWLFLPLASTTRSTAARADASKACKIEFDMCYGFSNGALEAMISPVFDRIANTLVDSFVKRAEQVYGPR